jgi:hypothetical protein
LFWSASVIGKRPFPVAPVARIVRSMQFDHALPADDTGIFHGEHLP